MCDQEVPEAMVCMYVCKVTHIARVWINRVGLPILLVVGSTGKMTTSLAPFAPDKSRDRFGRPVPRQPAHSPHSRYFSRLPRRRSFIYLKPPSAVGSVPSLWGHAIAYRWRSLPRVRRHKASSPQGSSTNGCYFFVTMDHFFHVSLFSHAIYTIISMKGAC